MKMALPRKGLRGVEKIADTTAWTNSMAESAGARVKDHLNNICVYIYVYIYIYMPALLCIKSVVTLMKMSLIQ